MPSGRNVFRKEGDYWTIVHARRLCRVKDLRGLRYLAHLLARPGKEVLALEIMIAVRGYPAVTLVRIAAGDDGCFPDASARASYRTRLRELGTELEEAEGANDIGRAERIRMQIEILEGEVKRGLGLMGPRPPRSDIERARVSVTKAIGLAITRIEAFNPALADHLRVTIRRGTYCLYAPDPRVPIRWIV